MKFLPLVALAFAAAVFSQAKAQATITWAPLLAITGDSDVSTNGTLVSAYNFGNYTTILSPATDVIINGVTFVAGNNNSVAEGVTHNFDAAPGDSPYGSTSPFFTNLSANYQNLLANGVSASDLTSRALTLQQLVPGYTYEVQIWVNDSSGTGPYSEVITDGISDDWTSIVRFPGSNGPDQQTRLGGNVIGTFVADGIGTQIIRFLADPISHSFSHPVQINALQLRQIAVPEPASALLGGLSLGLLALRRRRA